MPIIIIITTNNISNSYIAKISLTVALQKYVLVLVVIVVVVAVVVKVVE